MVLRELVTRLGFQFDENAYKRAEQAFQNLKSKGESISAVGQKLSLFVTAPITALATAAVVAANQQSDNLEVLRNTFAEIGDEAEATSRRISNSFGLSIANGAKFLSTTGAILQNFGLTNKQVLETSEAVIELGANLAAFKKVDTAETIEMIKDALAGRLMSLKKLGIVIDQQEVKERIALMRSKGQVFATQQQAEALATLSLIQQRAAFAAGAYQKQMSGLDETKARIISRLADLGAKFGKFLLPIVEKVASAIEKFLIRLEKLDDKTTKFILVLGGIAAAIGPVLIAVGGLVSALGVFGQGLLFLKTASFAALVPMGLLALKFIAIAAVVGLAFLALEDLYQFFTGGESVFGDFVKWINQLIDSLKELAVQFSNWIDEGFKSVFGDFIKWINDVLGSIGKLSMEFSKWFSGKALAISNLFPKTASPQQISSGGTTVSNNVNNAPNVNINVNAAGMTPTDAADAVATGVQSGLSNVFRQAAQNFKPAGSY
jgi:hypothetical protein